MRRSATLHGLDEPARQRIDSCADYLLKYKKNMQYDQYLKMGLPIATGVIEGACRYLVKDRMDRTGARWSLKGAEAVLRLRALRTSGDFDAYWPSMKSKSIFVITSLSTLAVKSRRSVVEPKSISGASSSLSSFDSLRSSEPQKLPSI